MSSILALPVSVEQIAVTIKQMSPEERQRLLDLVPEFRATRRTSAPRTLAEARASAAKLRAEMQSARNAPILSPDDPFLGGLTLAQYLALPDAERAKVWERLTETTWSESDEREVKPDAVPAC